ncbi:MAG: DJ-1/PfpI family protein, partial [Coprobacillaceae bacterium]
ASICAAPIVLQAAGVITNTKGTGYPGFASDLVDATVEDSLVGVDKHIITSKGPATALLFAYTILETLGIDSDSLQEAMQYNALLMR